jgi:hypothetical protein
MSSPIARPEKHWIERRLVNLHHSLSHQRRVAILAETIAAEIRRNFPVGDGGLGGVDIGCGDMSVAEGISAKEPHVRWTCLDIYPLPESLHGDPRWSKYRQFDGATLPLDDQSVDFALFTDVLHHVPDPRRAPLLREAARVARAVIVKDHFEYGMPSRAILRAMDFVGNWGYGVSVPERYFDEASFRALVTSARLRVASLRTGIDLYRHLGPFHAIFRPRWQFIATLLRPA